MATAQATIIRALRKGHVTANGETPPTEVLSAAIDTLNDMLEAWRDDKSIDFGLGTLTLATELAVDAGAIRAIVYNLAVELANDEHVSVPSQTREIAERSLAALAGRFLGSRRIRFPRALTSGRGAYDVDSD